MHPVWTTKHRGIVGTDHGRSYAMKNLVGALADPAISHHCKFTGMLFPEYEKVPPTPALMRDFLKGVHPVTGGNLKPVTNTGTRLQDGREVSNTCFAFDIPLTVGKSVSIAGLVLGDIGLLDLVYQTTSAGYRRIGNRMDRRAPRRRNSEAVIPTGLALVGEVPEKADRFGHPNAHMHGYIINTTAYQDGVIRRYCAAHFGRIAREAGAAQRWVDRELHRKLKRLGYPVRMVGNRCELDSIPRWLVERWTAPLAADTRVNWAALSDVDRRQERRRLDDAYVLTRGAKTFQPLTHWQLAWEAEIGPRQLATVAKAHFAAIRPPNRAQIPSQRVAAATRPATADQADDTQDVLQPITKRVLLGALPRGYQPPAQGNPPPSCDELIAVSRIWAVQSISHELRHPVPSSARRIEVHGSELLTPWFAQFLQLMELSFPGAIVVPRPAALARPQVRAVADRPGFAAAVAQAAAYFAEQLQKTPPDELRRVTQLLRLGREDTQCLRSTDSIRMATRHTGRPGFDGQNPEIYL